MKTTIAAVLFFLSLAACAPLPPASSPEHAKARAECDYDARKATAAILNSFEAAWRKIELEKKCLQMRGYKN